MIKYFKRKKSLRKATLRELIKKKVPTVGKGGSVESETKLTMSLVFPTLESPINKILKERS